MTRKGMVFGAVLAAAVTLWASQAPAGTIGFQATHYCSLSVGKFRTIGVTSSAQIRGWAHFPEEYWEESDTSPGYTGTEYAGGPWLTTMLAETMSDPILRILLRGEGPAPSAGSPGQIDQFAFNSSYSLPVTITTAGSYSISFEDYFEIGYVLTNTSGNLFNTAQWTAQLTFRIEGPSGALFTWRFTPLDDSYSSTSALDNLDEHFTETISRTTTRSLAAGDYTIWVDAAHRQTGTTLVPAPASLLLLGTGFLGLLALGYRRSR